MQNKSTQKPFFKKKTLKTVLKRHHDVGLLKYSTPIFAYVTVQKADQ